MPYIKQEARRRIHGKSFTAGQLSGPGELNYTISKVVNTYLRRFPKLGYDAINEVIGVLECAKLELYRRVSVPYEQAKMIQNGDVYDSKFTDGVAR